MSFSLWPLVCKGIQNKNPGSKAEPGLYADAIQGRLGAQVALLQSPIPPNAPPILEIQPCYTMKILAM
jgi:phage-related protein